MCNELTRESFDRPFSFIKLFGRKQQIQLVAAIKHVFQSTSPTRGDDRSRKSGMQNNVPFQSTSPTRGDDGGCVVVCMSRRISIHVPYERGRPRTATARGPSLYFNPRPLREGTTHPTAARTSLGLFQSTSPTRGDDAYSVSNGWERIDFNPRPLREGTTGDYFRIRYHRPISIHVPYERGRLKRQHRGRLGRDFNPRPLREGTTGVPANSVGMREFQSTSPTRGDDRRSRSTRRDTSNFNPRPLREGTTRVFIPCVAVAIISIHVPYERGRHPNAVTCHTTWRFQSTSPTRGDDVL